MQHPGILCQSIRVVAQSAIPQSNEEHAVRPKGDMPTPVIRQRLLNLQNDAFCLRHGHGDVSLCGAHLANHRASRFILRVAEIKQAVCGKLRMKGDAVHAFLKEQDSLHPLAKIQKQSMRARAIELEGRKLPPLHGHDHFPCHSRDG